MLIKYKIKYIKRGEFWKAATFEADYVKNPLKGENGIFNSELWMYDN